MDKRDSPKEYDLDERTFQFASDVIQFVKLLPRTISNIEIVKQLVRSAGSVGANYIEASESLGKKDFILHVKICRKEAKECRYWLRLVEVSNKKDVVDTRDSLSKEVTELMKIFGSIIEKAK
ncbi:MAG: four helix bundle protein [Dehalococcoidia bacterium]|jgi:four helix bundle protein